MGTRGRVDTSPAAQGCPRGLKLRVQYESHTLLGGSQSGLFGALGLGDGGLHLHDHVLLLLDLRLHCRIVLHLVDRQVERFDGELFQGRMILARVEGVPIQDQLHDRYRFVLPRDRIFLLLLDDFGLVHAVHNLIVNQTNQLIAPFRVRLLRRHQRAGHINRLFHYGPDELLFNRRLRTV